MAMATFKCEFPRRQAMLTAAQGGAVICDKPRVIAERIRKLAKEQGNE